jgi:intracellular sulfur oxidation DsrE/DsrF family protein
MGTGETRSALARRSFLARFGAGAAAFGAAFAASPSTFGAQLPAVPATPWQPARHGEDDWLDQVSAKHRVFIDTISADGFGQAMLFGNNTFTANRTGYGLTDADVALVICARHKSTPFGFSDEMWAKYGAALAERASFSDPKTKQPPTVNVFQTSGYGQSLLNNGVLLDAMIKRGVRIAVCALATRAASSLIAQKTGGKIDDIFKELTEHMVPNAHLVPAGIVAVNRAQERGYSFAYAG